MDGQIVENLHVVAAQRILAKAQAIWPKWHGRNMHGLDLILGLALWCGGHFFKRLAPDARARMGDAGKGAGRSL